MKRGYIPRKVYTTSTWVVGASTTYGQKAKVRRRRGEAEAYRRGVEYRRSVRRCLSTSPDRESRLQLLDREGGSLTEAGLAIARRINRNAEYHCVADRRIGRNLESDFRDADQVRGNAGGDDAGTGIIDANDDLSGK